MENFTVYGGCYARGIFKYLEGDYNPSVTVGQCSITSMFDDPFDIPIEEIDKGHDFEKRMLFYDINKLGEGVLLDSAPNNDWLILDLSCERLALLQLMYRGKVTRITNSKFSRVFFSDLPSSGIWKDLRVLKKIYSMDWKNEYESNIRRFADSVSKAFGQDRIILCEVKLVSEYVGEDGIKPFIFGQREEISELQDIPEYGNYVLDKAYKVFRECLPDTHFIPFPENVLADKNHYLGIHTAHFTDHCYLYAAEAVKVICNNYERSKEIETIEMLRKRCESEYLHIRKE